MDESQLKGQGPGMERVKVYGTDWCGDTKHTRAFLDALGVAYRYIDIEEDEAAARWVREQNDGRERKPTVKLGERVLSVPDNGELESVLREEGLVG
jgi:mycoredoxin